MTTRTVQSTGATEYCKILTCFGDANVVVYAVKERLK